LLNPDTIILNNALQKMILFLDNHPEAGVVGPELLSPNGAIQNSSKDYFPSIFNVLLLSYIFRRVFRTYEYSHRNITGHVCWVIGSCLMVKRITIEQVGLLNERLTFFFEDADLCLRVNRAGWKVYFLKEAKIIHYRGASWEQLDFPSLLGWQTLYQFFRIHHGNFYANCFRFILLIEKCFVSSLCMVIPRRFKEKRLGNNYAAPIRYFTRIGSLKLPNSDRSTEVRVFLPKEGRSRR